MKCELSKLNIPGGVTSENCKDDYVDNDTTCDDWKKKQHKCAPSVKCEDGEWGVTDIKCTLIPFYEQTIKFTVEKDSEDGNADDICKRLKDIVTDSLPDDSIVDENQCEEKDSEFTLKMKVRTIILNYFEKEKIVKALESKKFKFTKKLEVKKEPWIKIRLVVIIKITLHC